MNVDMELDFIAHQNELHQQLYKAEQLLVADDLPSRSMFLIKLTASSLNGCQFCLDMHKPEALKAGLDEVEIDLLLRKRVVNSLSMEEQLIVTLCGDLTQLSNVELNADYMDEMCQALGEHQVLQVIAHTVMINSWNRIAKACGMKHKEETV